MAGKGRLKRSQLVSAVSKPVIPEKPFCHPNFHFVSQLKPIFALLSPKNLFWPGGTTIDNK